MHKVWKKRNCDDDWFTQLGDWMSMVNSSSTWVVSNRVLSNSTTILFAKIRISSLSGTIDFVTYNKVNVVFFMEDKVWFLHFTLP